MSHRDDTPTLRRKQPPGMTDTDRALAGRARSHPLGVPIQSAPDDPEIELEEVDITSPVELLELPPQHESEVEVVRRLRGDTRDPAMTRLAEYVGKLAYRLDQQRRRERSNNQERANQLLELLDRVPGEAAAKLRTELVETIEKLNAEVAETVERHDDEIKDLRRTSSIASKIVWGALTGALAALVYLGNLIWARSEHDTAVEWRLRRLEERDTERSRPDRPAMKDHP